MLAVAFWQPLHSQLAVAFRSAETQPPVQLPPPSPPQRVCVGGYANHLGTWVCRTPAKISPSDILGCTAYRSPLDLTSLFSLSARTNFPFCISMVSYYMHGVKLFVNDINCLYQTNSRRSA